MVNAFEKFYNELNADTKFNEAYLINLHKFAFEELYDFAGVFREDDISKGNTFFCKAIFLSQQSKLIFNELEKENFLKDFTGTKEQLAERITYYMSELNALHPFYEGNGRITRMFFDLILNYNGYSDIDYGESLEILSEVNEFIVASKEAMAGNTQKLYSIILKGIKKR